MLKLAWRGVRHNLGRYVATLVAIMTGVAFFTATGFVSDRVIDTLEGDVNRQYGAVDVAVVVDDVGRRRRELRRAAPASRGAAADQIAAPTGSRRAPASSAARWRSSVRTARPSATAPPDASGSRTRSSTPSTSARAGPGGRGRDRGRPRAGRGRGPRRRRHGDRPERGRPVRGDDRRHHEFGSADAIDSGGTVSIPRRTPSTG